MKNKGREVTSFFISFISTVSVFFIYIFSSPTMSSAGDMNITEFLSRDNIDSGFFFIGPLLADLLRGFDKFIHLNWWFYFSIFIAFVFVFVSSFCICRTLEKHQMKSMSVLVIVLYCFIIWEDILKYDINFTQTACMAALSGILLIIECLNNKKKYVSFLCVGCGVLLLVFASQIRYKAMLLTLPVALMIIVYKIYMERKNVLELKSIIASGVIILVVVLSTIVATRVSYVYNPTLEEYKKGNENREYIFDYMSRYPSYEGNEELYESIGIKESWIKMVSMCLTSDQNNFSSSDLEKMIELREESKTSIEDFVKSLDGHKVLWEAIALFVIITIFLVGPKRCALPLFGSLLYFAVCALYFIYIGRYAWRVTNGVVAGALLSFFFMADCKKSDEAQLYLKQFSKKINSKVRVDIIVCALLLCWVSGTIYSEDRIWKTPKEGIVYARGEKILNYMNSNKDTLYLDVDGGHNFWKPTHTLWTPRYTDNYLSNSIPLLGNFSIGMEDFLKSEYGVNNIYEDMLVRGDMLVIYSTYGTTTIYDYYVDYYNPYITVSLVDWYEEDVPFMRYTAPVNPTEKKYEDISVMFDKCSCLFLDDNESISEMYQIKCSLAGDVSSYSDYYLNIYTRDEEIYTYGLRQKNDSVMGVALRMKDSWEMGDIEKVVIVARENHTYYEISDITNTVMHMDNEIIDARESFLQE